MLLIHNATLIDGAGAAPVPDAAVLIEGERIVAAGPRPAVAAPADGEAIDLRGRTLLPGLIDTHDHLASHGYDLAGRLGLGEPRSLSHLRTAAVLRETLAMGYTTVRDAGGLDAGFKQAVEGGLIPGPRLVLSLSIISPTGGIGDRVAPSGATFAADDPALPAGVADGPEAVRAAVRAMVRAGADAIKCATTGGASSRPGHGPKDPAFTAEEMRALVDEAHLHGRKVLCHALGGPGLRVAVEAGVDSIEHGCYLDEQPDLIERMAADGIALCPTLSVYVYHRRSPAPHVQARGLDLEQHHAETVRRALAAGVRIIAGTDAGGHNHPPNAIELPLLAAAGLTPMQALQAATSWAADAIGRGDDLGTVQAGKLADLVAVDGDPLADLSLLEQRERIALVIKGGSVVTDRRAGNA